MHCEKVCGNKHFDSAFLLGWKKVSDSKADANNGITMKTMIEQSYDGSNDSDE